jgi:hypothetical protein
LVARTDPPIMVRARITASEWERVRVAALRENRAAADWIGEAIRTKLGSKGAGSK